MKACWTTRYAVAVQFEDCV